MKKRSLNNMGFSLIELIVAVLIIAIISGSAIVMFGFIFGKETEAAAASVSDVMKQARSEALARENNDLSNGCTNVYARFYKSDSKIYADICTDYSTDAETVITTLSTQKICKDQFKVSFYDTSGATPSDVGDVGSDEVFVYFKKATGGTAKVKVNKSTGGSVLYDNVQLLKISDGSDGTDYQDLILVALTGRCYVD